MCSKKGDPNYYRCDTNCNDDRRKRRANKDALEKALDDKDMRFIAAQAARLDPTDHSDPEDHYYEASQRVDHIVERFTNGERISYQEITRAEQDIRYMGGLLAAEAEERAGTTAAEIHEDWSERYLTAVQEYQELAETERQHAEHLEDINDDDEYNAYWDNQVAPNQKALLAKYEEVDQLRSWSDEETVEKVNALADAYRHVLAEERRMGGSVEAVGDNEEGYRAIANNTHYLPAAWVEACNESPYELHIDDVNREGAEQYTNRAAFYEKVEYPGDDGRVYVGSKIALPSDEMGTIVGERKAVHEYMHHIQSRYKDRIIEKLEAVHLENRRRIINGKKEPVQVIARGDTFQEWGYTDHFADNYMGKVNDSNQHYEIMTTGVEALFKGSYYGLVRRDGSTDTDMRNFVLGIMARI